MRRNFLLVSAQSLAVGDFAAQPAAADDTARPELAAAKAFLVGK